ncbi:unnamed protein product [Echinostoma caproni]|uniref:Transcription factor CBF/NF-Y/archaeal histone domain-containing protein n=1 Tax=Echinostoma caproni TaxID=27848 RepID=A0A3P8I9J7_9TREM|nr:unnamed protein product [Echinostoma caproni]
MPIANVAKIMRRAVPGNGKIAKDAKECVQECVSEFISFITSEAAERCQTEKRKTINGEDILCAMNTLGFDNYVEPLKSFLVKFREMSKLESAFLEESPSATVAGSSTTMATPAGSTVILAPTLLTTNTAGLTTVASNSLTAGRQFTLVNGTAADLAGATVITPQSSGQDIKVPTAAMTSLGTPISTSLGTTIILPISPQVSITRNAKLLVICLHC